MSSWWDPVGKPPDGKVMFGRYKIGVGFGQSPSGHREPPAMGKLDWLNNFQPQAGKPGGIPDFEMLFEYITHAGSQDTCLAVQLNSAHRK